MGSLRVVGALLCVFLLAGLLSACGDDDDGGDQPTATTAASTAMSDAGAGEPTATSEASSPTAQASTATEAPADDASAPATESVASPTAAGEQLTLNVYFIRDERLTVAHRTIPHTLEVGAASMTQLLEGPTADEAALDFTSAIPDGTEFLGLTIEDGIATVDLSSAYESGGGSLSMAARLAQVVYTLTQFPTVNAVEFLLDGEAVDTFGGEGVVLDGPVTRNHEALLPAIFLESVAAGDQISSPVRLAGTANTFEATFAVRILGEGDEILIEQVVTATSGSGTRGTFETTVPFSVAEPTPGKVVVFEYSARDGSMTNVIEIPVVLQP